jgi:hypothetical protein
MNTKVLSTIAVVIGCICAAFAIGSLYVVTHIAATIPGIDPGTLDSRYFWWPVCAAVVLWGLACFGFISGRQHRRSRAA